MSKEIIEIDEETFEVCPICESLICKDLLTRHIEIHFQSDGIKSDIYIIGNARIYTQLYYKSHLLLFYCKFPSDICIIIIIILRSS